MCAAAGTPRALAPPTLAEGAKDHVLTWSGAALASALHITKPRALRARRQPSGRRKERMNRMVTIVPAVLLVLGAGSALAMPAAGGPARLRIIEAARGDVVGERGEFQAPRAAGPESSIEPRRSQDVPAPRGESVQAPRVKVARATEVKDPRWRED
jgi:hypothetical protein